MTAVISPPSFSNISRPAWGGQAHNSMSADDVRGILLPQRKSIPRTNSASSISSTSSTSSNTTVVSSNPAAKAVPASPVGDVNGWANGAPRKRPPPKAEWQAGKPEGQPDFSRLPGARPPLQTGINGVASIHSPAPMLPSQAQGLLQGRNGVDQSGAPQPTLCLLSLNGTFEQKKISVPFYPDTLRIGRQTNAKTVPTPSNGFFDSKVLSRQHAEIWADRNGKIWIRDVKSSNGTFVNGQRLSQENRESEPHELQSQDQLELGIDIVNEDQKTVMHHKVAAKVEHAGFMSPSSSLLDMNFPDLDPSNGPMMMPLASLPTRGRAGSQASVGANGRMAPNPGMANGQANGLGPQRQFWMTPITTEHIVKKLHTEMRNARLQSQDLARTGQFITALLSKEDIKPSDKPEVPEPPRSLLVNGNSTSFRADGKARFSDPPAPPPQQPLPEKPDAPSLKRGTTERPRSHPPNSTTSPIQQDHLSKILSLQEALNAATREIEMQTTRMKELEEKFQREKEARQHAEGLVQRLEDAMASKANGAAVGTRELDQAFDETLEAPADTTILSKSTQPPSPSAATPTDSRLQADPTTSLLQSRIDVMMGEMRDLRQQLGDFKQRAETAEAERDADRKTLAEMVLQIRQRDEEARRAAEEKAARKSRSRSRPSGAERADTGISTAANGPASSAKDQLDSAETDPLEGLSLSRQNTITPATSALGTLAQDHALIQGLPYASMLGVVLLGMGLMAYMNGWQPRPPLDQ